MAVRVQFGFPAVPYSAVFRRAVDGGAVRWVYAAVARWKQRRLLEELDERMLRDIGISRSEALAEANKPWWRR
jgi:uncharacterized protein YjiS (DUF1127 family)